VGIANDEGAIGMAGRTEGLASAMVKLMLRALLAKLSMKHVGRVMGS
jgi:hypothetical protein